MPKRAMMSSHSETTKPLSEDEIAELERGYDVAGRAGVSQRFEVAARLIATIRSRDERIRALSDMLQEVRDTHELWSPRWNYGHSPMRMQRDEEMEQRIDVLLKKADDG